MTVLSAWRHHSRLIGLVGEGTEPKVAVAFGGRGLTGKPP